MIRVFLVYRMKYLILLTLMLTFNEAIAQDSPSNPEVSTVLDTIREAYPDGSPSRIYTVQHGTTIRQGTAISYHPNGKVAVEAPYVDGKLDGVFHSYFENGKTWQTIGYRKGIEEGITTTYFENGFKKSKEVYRSGILHGDVEEYYESGKLRRRLPYILGQLHGTAKVFDELGTVTEEMTFEKGLRHGPYRKFNKGIKTFEAKFANNRCVENCDF